MTGLGASIAADADAMAEAELVGRETMRRARRNVEKLVRRLPEFGYTFDPGEGLSVLTEPAGDVADRLNELEDRVGILPLTFRWWSEEVGVVNLMGSGPDIPARSDPLVVEAPLDYMLGEAAVWLEDRNTEWDQGNFAIGFSPDFLYKAGVSGGAPYSLTTPADGVDGLVRWENHNTTFANYLRIAFNNAGFLGWSSAVCERTRPDWLADLASELEPL